MRLQHIGDLTILLLCKILISRM